MSDYIISCCSTADLSKEHFDARDIKYTCFHYTMNGVSYLDDLGQSISLDDFYKKMSEGADTKTSQLNAEEYAAYFTPFLEAGKDILHMHGLQGYYNEYVKLEQP